jgi:rare lipoprotein A
LAQIVGTTRVACPGFTLSLQSAGYFRVEDPIFAREGAMRRDTGLKLPAVATLAAALILGGCAGDDALHSAAVAPIAIPAPVAVPPPVPAPVCVDTITYSEQGPASWYGADHQGRLTASGVRFDMNRLTAAHRQLPFGTRLEVTNLANGRTVTVVVNDRGPYVGRRIVDLSRKAADDLGFVRQGVTRVRIDALAGSCG